MISEPPPTERRFFVLDRYFIRPTTVDRIRSSWIGDAIERYVSWLAEQNYAARSIFIRVPLLIRFGESAQRAGAKTLADLPAPVNDRVRRIDEKTGIIRTIAGTTKGFGGDGGPPLERS